MYPPGLRQPRFPRPSSTDFDVRPAGHSEVETVYAELPEYQRNRNSLDRFEWLYGRGSQAGTLILIYVESELAGIVGLIPERICFGDCTVNVLRVVDLATLHQHIDALDAIHTSIAGANINQPVVCVGPPESSVARTSKLWHRVSTQQLFVRPNRPSALTRSSLVRVFDPIISSLLRVNTWGKQLGESMTRVLDPTPVDVVGMPDIPVEGLAMLYREQPPSNPHFERTDSYYRRLAGDPNLETRTYLAYRHGTVVRGLLLGKTTFDTTSVVRILDVAPPITPGQPVDVLDALLSIALRETGDVDLLVATGDALPPNALARYGFIRLPPRLVPSHLTRPTALLFSGREHGEHSSHLRHREWHLTHSDLE